MTKRGEGDWGQHLLHSKSSTTTKNGMENKMTKKGEGGWGQHLCHSKYYKFKRVWGQYIYHSKYHPKKFNKKGEPFTNALDGGRRGLGAASLPRKKVQQQKRHLSQTGGLEKRGHDGHRV